MKFLADIPQEVTVPPGSIDFNKLRGAFPTGSLPARGDLTLGLIISNAFNYIFVIAGLLLLFLLISNGFSLMVGANEPKTKETAGKNITNAFVGFIILFVSYWLVQIIETVLGISILK